MVRNADAVSLNDDEQAIVDAFPDDRTSTVVEVVRHASAVRPPSRVREAYWELVSEGVIVPTAAGTVTLKLPAHA